MAPRILVVGAGFAGCAAALACAAAGYRVCLHEAARAPGGRARTVERNGVALDNGQHLLLGAYHATAALVAALHADGSPLRRERLVLAPLQPRQAHALELRARNLPAPLSLATALACARGLTLRERMAGIAAFAGWKRRKFRCAPGATVADLLRPLPDAVARRLWVPLCLAALNTPIERASAQVFLNVLQAAFDADADAADALVATRPLGELLPEPALRALRAQHHVAACGSRVRVTASSDAGVRASIDLEDATFDAAIVAVGPHQLAATLDPALRAHAPIADALDAVGRFAYEPITTVYLAYAVARLALPPGLVRLDDAPGQWVFDRTDLVEARSRERLLAVVISTSGPHDAWPQARLADAVHAQLARALPLPPPAWTQVIAERRATYACTPGLAHPPARIAPRLFLAGDYVYPRFPATLEAAVCSGQAAAAQVDAALAGREAASALPAAAAAASTSASR